ncbi:thiamine pyrophosphate-dependent enzyme [Thauera aromatica]|nr:alpha-ketoacid dehydrogenase subunit alpha/beta [Thauera aromatica]MCK2127694.1 thiamine pyrophosphate-dependent enzyme [Thauera aromatica]
MPLINDLRYDAPWQEVIATADDWDHLGPATVLRMLHHLHLVRAFEETVLELDGEGLVHGPAHSSIGQDGGAVGAVSLLRSSDLITGSHRGHHQFLAKGLAHLDQGEADPRRTPLSEGVRTMLYRALAEILGLADGYCRGRGGSMHLRWAEAGALGTNAIVGGGVPLATGAAWACKRRGAGDVAFTFLGDGAVNIGAVPESMNLAALWSLPVCFFIENNGYAVSTRLSEETRETRLSSRGGAYGIAALRVDGMDPVAVRVATQRAVDAMRAGQGPYIIEAEVYRYFHHGGGLPGSAFGYRSKEEEAAWRARDPLACLARGMIERDWLSADEDAALRAGARACMAEIVARLTEKGGAKRRIVPALWPQATFRDEGVRGDLAELAGVRYEELETASGKVGEVKFIGAVAGVMARRMECDERIFCLGEDIHKLNGGTNGATRGLAARFPDRIVPTPIAEQGFVGLAGGVAMEGHYRPVVELMYADFALVAADPLFNQIGKARHMFGGDMAVPLVLRSKCAIGTGYGSQHSMDPAGLYAMWPGWRIVAPSTPFDYVGLMNSALQCDDPVLVIEHVGLYNTTAPGPLEDFDYYIPLGKAKVVRPGTAFTVLTYLAMTPLAVKVADELGVDAEVIDLRSLDRAGIDWETIGDSVRKTNNVVILEQGSVTASYGALLADEVQRRLFDHLDQPVKRIHGGEAAPNVSKVLERAAFVGAEEVRAGFIAMMADAGRPLAQTAQALG